MKEVHSIPRKKKKKFKPKKEVGPFIVYSRSALHVVETMMQGMGFEQGEIFQYNPLRVINNRRV